MHAAASTCSSIAVDCTSPAHQGLPGGDCGVADSEGEGVMPSPLVSCQDCLRPGTAWGGVLEWDRGGLEGIVWGEVLDWDGGGVLEWDGGGVLEWDGGGVLEWDEAGELVEGQEKSLSYKLQYMYMYM